MLIINDKEIEYKGNVKLSGKTRSKSPAQYPYCIVPEGMNVVFLISNNINGKPRIAKAVRLIGNKLEYLGKCRFMTTGIIA